MDVIKLRDLNHGDVLKLPGTNKIFVGAYVNSA